MSIIKKALHSTDSEIPESDNEEKESETEISSTKYYCRKN